MLQDITQVVLAKTLDATSLRHRAIANNLANVETPGYERQDVSFEAELRSALDSPGSTDDSRQAEVFDDGAIDGVQSRLIGDATQPARQDGNNVDADREMARLAENTIHYQAILQSYNLKESMVRTAIYEGKR